MWAKSSGKATCNEKDKVDPRCFVLFMRRLVASGGVRIGWSLQQWVEVIALESLDADLKLCKSNHLPNTGK